MELDPKERIVRELCLAQGLLHTQDWLMHHELTIKESERIQLLLDGAGQELTSFFSIGLEIRDRWMHVAMNSFPDEMFGDDILPERKMSLTIMTVLNWLKEYKGNEVDNIVKKLNEINLIVSKYDN